MNAPQYVVTNGTLYMTKCAGKSVGPKEKAYLWKKQEAASNQAEQMNKRDKVSVWRAELVEGTADTQTFNPEALAVNSVPEFREMLDALFRCVQSMETVKEMMNKCVNEISNQDKIQEDLLHKIEFESLGGGNGAHLCSLLQKCRQKRRGYKDMLTLIQFVSNKSISGISVAELMEMKDRLGGRLYKTRTNQVF